MLAIIAQLVTGQDYYWSAGKKHFLSNIPGKFIVKPKKDVSDNSVLKMSSSMNDIKKVKLINTKQDVSELKSSKLFNAVYLSC